MPDNKSKMAENCPSKNDMQLVFKRLRSVNTNKVRIVAVLYNLMHDNHFFQYDYNGLVEDRDVKKNVLLVVRKCPIYTLLRSFLIFKTMKC
jgi:hypothetical protein